MTKSIENQSNNKGGNPDWVKGMPSPHPEGRPKKGNAWADIYNEVLDSHEIELRLKDRKGNEKEIYLRTENNRTFRYAITIGLIKAAMNGDVSAARELADRTAGKPKQTIDYTDRDNIIKIVTGEDEEGAGIAKDLEDMI